MDRCPTCKRLTKRARRKEPTRVGGKTRAEEKAERRARERAEMAELRDKVFERACGKCELCHAYPADHLHHLDGGSGRRRQQQSAANTMAVCKYCHRDYHSSPKFFAVIVDAWATEHGYPLPASIRRAAP